MGTVAAVAAGMVCSTVIVFQSSYAAYSATTNNTLNNWTTGTVTLTDDDAGGVMFNWTNAKPGQTETRCIVVTAGGTLPATVKFYGQPGGSYDTGLAGQLSVQVTSGTGSSYAAGNTCTGFTPAGAAGDVYSGTLANLTSTINNYSTGVGAFSTTGSASVVTTYRFVVTLSASAPDSTSGKTAQATFVWESQGT